jgi:divinyl chlorophyllide a 8-vinyl-reductase
LFGNGTSAPCNPISESDLASFMLQCMTDPSRCNRILNIGGPTTPVTHRQYNTMMAAALGIHQIQFICIPLVLFDVVIGICDRTVMLARRFESSTTTTSSSSTPWIESIQNIAETIRIIYYYATVPMLTTHPDEIYGQIQLQEYYERIAQFGQEYDPHVSIFTPPSRTSSSSPSNSIPLASQFMPKTNRDKKGRGVPSLSASNIKSTTTSTTTPAWLQPASTVVLYQQNNTLSTKVITI